LWVTAPVDAVIVVGVDAAPVPQAAGLRWHFARIVDPVAVSVTQADSRANRRGITTHFVAAQRIRFNATGAHDVTAGNGRINASRSRSLWCAAELVAAQRV